MDLRFHCKPRVSMIRSSAPQCYNRYDQHPCGRLAQLGEHGVRNAGVVGSNPMPSTIQSLNCTVPYRSCSLAFARAQQQGGTVSGSPAQRTNSRPGSPPRRRTKNQSPPGARSVDDFRIGGEDCFPYSRFGKKILTIPSESVKHTVVEILVLGGWVLVWGSGPLSSPATEGAQTAVCWFGLGVVLRPIGFPLAFTRVAECPKLCEPHNRNTCNGLPKRPSQVSQLPHGLVLQMPKLQGAA